MQNFIFFCFSRMTHPFHCFECVCVDSLCIVEVHVVAKGFTATADRQERLGLWAARLDSCTDIMYPHNIKMHSHSKTENEYLVAILNTSVAQAAKERNEKILKH